MSEKVIEGLKPFFGSEEDHLSFLIAAANLWVNRCRGVLHSAGIEIFAELPLVLVRVTTEPNIRFERIEVIPERAGGNTNSIDLTPLKSIVDNDTLKFRDCEDDTLKAWDFTM